VGPLRHSGPLVSAGKVDTVLVEPIVKWVEENNAKMNLQDRVASVEEMAELIAFLVSPGAAYMTGEHSFDGGEMTTTPA